ncbi:unnamed protein product [Staurois parvus]|uniref:Secreted protein n=1 Tax=Staurois parvus TaxID=386267 RepID=A0ABN9AFE9_9NEOB|nr:unnamed protein product [Staurois parvus]
MILTLLTPAPAWARSLPPSSMTPSPAALLLFTRSIFAVPLGSSSPSSTSSPVIGRLCASPELQFRRPITGED